MRKRSIFTIGIMTAWLALSTAWAGPYAPAAGETGSTAVHMDDPSLVSWAVEVTSYLPGAHVDDTWQTSSSALASAEGNSFDVVALGDGGTITLRFDPPIENGDGWDFAVFENSFSDTYLELAYVEVSSNGENFVRFDSVSLTPNPVTGFGNSDPTDIDGLAGKYRQGYGTPFDLDALGDQPDVVSGIVDLTRVTHVRIIDIVGDGSFEDSMGNPVYDPYPTKGSAGFDLDAVGVLNGSPLPDEPYTPPEIPSESGDAGFGDDRGCFVTAVGSRWF